MARYSNEEGILREFFADENVQFPKFPALVGGVHVYQAPWGLGIQFRGGAQRIVVRGGNSYSVWDFLSTRLDGLKEIPKILSEAKDSGVSPIEVASFLKTLHCYHLLRDSEADRVGVMDVRVGVHLAQQMNYYNRILPMTGRNQDASQALERLFRVKVLLVVNDELLEFAARGLYEACIRNVGLLKIVKDGRFSHSFEAYEGMNLLSEHTYEYSDGSGIENALDKIIEDYSYVLAVVREPSVRFLGDIAHMCNIKQRPFLPITLVENEYSVGPFFFPHMDTACITCANLRSQSVTKGAADEYVYQNHLEENGEVSNVQIAGFDIQGLEIVINLAVSQLKQQVAELTSPKYINQIMRLNVLNLSLTQELVLRVPGCTSCSD